MHEAFLGTRILTQRLLQRQGMNNEHIIYFLSLSIVVMIFTGHPMTLELNSFQMTVIIFRICLYFHLKKLSFWNQRGKLIENPEGALKVLSQGVDSTYFCSINYKSSEGQSILTILCCHIPITPLQEWGVVPLYLVLKLESSTSQGSVKLWSIWWKYERAESSVHKLF